MKRWIVALIIAALWAAPCLAEDATENEGLSVGVVTNADTSTLEGRIGFDVAENWTLGLLGQWLTEDAMGRDLAGGAFVKMAVLPGATIPVSDWFGGLIPGIPDTLKGDTYVISKLLMYEADGTFTMSGAIGSGVQIGPVCLEAVYEIVEEGGTGNPTTESGLEVWAGVCLTF